MAGLSTNPILILKEGHTRDKGRDAQRNNILAARAVADAVKTTLGPNGMDKMLVESDRDVVITNDGATILWEMDIQHPVAKMIVEVARTQDDEVGDGTTTAVILAGELLANAEKLMDQGVHPTVIIEGYKEARRKAHQVLDEMAIEISKDDIKSLKKIAETAMTGKGIEIFKHKLSEICVDGAIAIEENGKVDVEDKVKVIKISGGSVGDSKINYGIVLDKERLNPEMQKDRRRQDRPPGRYPGAEEAHHRCQDQDHRCRVTPELPGGRRRCPEGTGGRYRQHRGPGSIL